MLPQDKKKTILRVSIPLITVVLLLFLPSSIVTPIMSVYQNAITQTAHIHQLGN